MKYNNEPLRVRARATAIIPRPEKSIELQIQAIPLDFGDRLDKHLPEPEPRVITTKRNGKVTRALDSDDEQYQAELLVNRQRRSALTIREALTADPNISFDADSEKDWAARADGILREFVEAGFSDGDTGMLIEQIDMLSNNTHSQVEAVKRDFLSRMAAVKKA